MSENKSIIDIANEKLPEKYHQLANKVLSTALNLGIKFEERDLGEGISGRFVADEMTVYFNPEYLQENTILHEAIHAVTVYYFNVADQEDLPQNIKTALKEIKYCYELLKDDFIKQHFYENGKPKEGVNIEKAFDFWTDNDNLYGLKSPTELIAEITKPGLVKFINDFDERNKGKNIFNKLIDAILSLFGISKQYSSVEGTIKNAMLELINNPSNELLIKYSNERATIKNNFKLFRESNHIRVNIDHDQLRKQFKGFFEEAPTNADYKDIDLTVSKLIAKDQGWTFTYPEQSLKKKPLTNSKEGTVFLFVKKDDSRNPIFEKKDEHYYAILKSDIVVDSENITIPLRFYSGNWLSTHTFDIESNENGIDRITNIKSTEFNQRFFNDKKLIVKNNLTNNEYQKIKHRIYSEIRTWESTNVFKEGENSQLFGKYISYNNKNYWYLAQYFTDGEIQLLELITTEEHFNEMEQEGEQIKKQCKGE